METERGRIGLLETGIVYVIFCLISLATFTLQKPLSQSEGKGWDGVAYYDAATQIAAGRFAPTGEAPFVYRIGTPALAAAWNRGDLVASFKWINFLASACMPLLLLLLLAPYVENRVVRIILVAVFLLSWQAPLRFSLFYPVASDPWSIAFLMAAMVAVNRWLRLRDFATILALSGLCLVGIFFRETMLLVPLAFLFADNPLEYDRNTLLFVRVRFPRLRMFVPLVAAGAGLFALRHFVHAVVPAGESSYSLAGAILANFFRKSFVTFLHGLFIFFGPLLTLAFFEWRQGLAFLRRHQAHAMFLILALSAAWVGGWDTERYAVMAVPVVFVLLGQAMETLWEALATGPLLIVLAVSQAVAERVFWAIPDSPTDFAHKMPLLTPWSIRVPFMDLYAYFRIYSETSGAIDMGRIKVAVAGWMEYLALVAALLLWLRFRTRMLSSAKARVADLAAEVR